MNKKSIFTSKQGSVTIVVVIVALVLAAVLGYAVLSKKSAPIVVEPPPPAGGLPPPPAVVPPTLPPVAVNPSPVYPSPPLPTSCTDKPEGIPVITSFSTYSGKVGTKIEIRGCNFAGFEGDKTAWIESSHGVKAIMYSEAGSTAKLMKMTLKSPLCQTDNSASGEPCEAWFTVNPGKYKIYTSPWGKKSNEVFFTVK